VTRTRQLILGGRRLRWALALACVLALAGGLLGATRAQSASSSLWVGVGPATLIQTTPPDTANACGSLLCTTQPVSLPEYSGTGVGAHLTGTLAVSQFFTAFGSTAEVDFLGTTIGAVVTGGGVSGGQPFVVPDVGSTFVFAPAGEGRLFVFNCFAAVDGCDLGIWTPPAPTVAFNSGLGTNVLTSTIDPGTITWLTYGSSATRVSVDPNSLALDHTGRYLAVRTDDPPALVVWDLQTNTIVDLGPLGPAGAGTPAKLPLAIDGSQLSGTHLYVAAGQFQGGSDGIDVYDLGNCPFQDPTQVDLQGAGAGCPVANWSALVSGTPVPYDVFGLRFTDASAGQLWLATSGSTGPETGYYLTSPGWAAPSPTAVTVVGDSYISGEGAGNYDPLTAGGLFTENDCHRSSRSMAQQIAADLAPGGIALDLSCSGATTANILNTAQYPGDPSTYGYNPQLFDYDDSSASGITLVGAGGDDNDFFGSLITHCAEVVFVTAQAGVTAPCLDSSAVAADAKFMHDTLFNSLVSVYSSLRQQADPLHNEVWAATYPLVVDPAGHDCASNVTVALDNQADLNAINDLEIYLNDVIVAAAQSAGVNVLDRSDALAGHELCDPPPVAFNGLTAGTGSPGLTIAGFTISAGPISRGSFHPNPLGQTLMAQDAIATYGSQFGQLSTPNPAPQPSTTAPDYTSAISVPSGQARAEELTVTGAGSTSGDFDTELTGLVPLSTVNAILHSTPTDLGSFPVDASGNATIDVPVPGTLGWHELQVTGTGADGAPVEGTLDFTVGSASDTDGDGIPNTSDTCPTIPTSAQDNATTYPDGVGVDCQDPASDTTPPTVSCGQADGQWHNANVTIACTASDGGSGLADPTQESFTLTTGVAAGTETASAQTNSLSVCDNAGNCATAGPVTGNMVDLAAPAVFCGSPNSQWHDVNVSISCTASDGGSGLANPGDSAFTLVTGVPAGSANSSASTGAHQVCDAAGNCTIAGPISGNMIDRIPPTVTCNATPTYVYGGAGGPVSASVTDSDSGPVATTVSAPADVSSAAPKAVLLTGADHAGNTTSTSCPYIVAKAPQTIHFTSQPPANPAVGGTYTVTATGGASGSPVVLTLDATTTAGACSITGVHLTFTGPGTCAIDANQAANINYLAAPQAQQTVTIKPTPATLCALTLHYVETSANYLKLPPIVRAVVAALANGSCQSLSQIVPRLTAPQEAALIKAYTNAVTTLAADGSLTSTQSTTLKTLATQL
jgi:hypothetical protein